MTFFQILLGKFRFYGVGLVGLLAILGALIAEKFFGILPCSLCIYSRYTLISIIIVSLATYFLPNAMLKGMQLVLIVIGLFMSLYHLGVEHKLWAAPQTCQTTFTSSPSVQSSQQHQLAALKAQIMKKKVIPCDRVNWRIFGFSATLWNAILIFLLGLWMSTAWWKEKH